MVFGALAVAIVGAPTGCGSGSTAPVVPVPALSTTSEAQQAFHRLSAHFLDAPPERRRTLEPELRAFLSRYPADDRARSVRLYLALIELGQGRLSDARSLAEAVRRGPPGAVHDYADVICAAILRREGKADAALGILLPLRGKIVDTDDVALYSEELVRALVARGRFDAAVRAMLDWAEEAPPADRDDTVSAIEALIRETPAPALEAGLGTLEQGAALAEPSEAPSEARLWLTEALRTRLERIALDQKDPELARRLVETRRLGIRHDDAADALSVLAETSAVLPRVAGRALGVVLDVTDDASKRRSAEVVEGMTRALGLSAGPARSDSVRLVTRDAEARDDVPRALSELAGDGASILVAGVSDDAAVAASLFADRARIAVLVLRRPSNPTGESFAFLLGESASDENAAIEAWLASGEAHEPVRVGPGGAPCDSVAESASGPRFPVKDWKRAGADAVLFFGDPGCTRDAALEASRAGVSGKSVLGLESGEVRDIGGPLFAVSAGRFPFGIGSPGPEERAWLDRWGSPPTWYETLGHDAAVLGMASLAGFPLDRVEDAGLVKRLHEKARDALSSAKANLWSTAATGFAGATVLSRTLAVVPVPSDRGRPE